MNFKPGDKVGAGRWPRSGEHPDNWGEPLIGVVMAVDEPEAWRGTIAFAGDDLPSRAAVREHLDVLANAGISVSAVPVLWLHAGKTEVYWLRPESLVSPACDRMAWLAARGNVRSLQRQAA